MAIRPYWSGTIRVSLVSLTVDMFTALDAKSKIAFHQIYRPTGERVRQQLVAGEDVVERADIVKGYEVSKDEYVLFDPAEISALKIPSSKSMELTRFVAYDAVDEIFFDTPYYLAPSARADLATFSVIRDAMRGMKVMGLGQIVISGRERLCAVKPCGAGMLLETLHYCDEIKRSGHYFGDIKKAEADSDEVELAKQLIQRKIGAFEPEAFHDRYSDALQELVDARMSSTSWTPCARVLRPTHRPTTRARAAERGPGGKSRREGSNDPPAIGTRVNRRVPSVMGQPPQAIRYSNSSTLIGANDNAPARGLNVRSSIVTCGAAPTRFCASRFGPTSRQDRPLLADLKPWISSLRLCGCSVALTTATISALRSFVSAADTSSGQVGLPVLTLGWSP
ncbi:MAG: Ku protein, partial [Asticcacaulis sp.]|nr:Ku protein [Asticcacaulis sp.]